MRKLCPDVCVCVCVCVCVEIVAHFYEIPPVALDKAPHLPTINVCTLKYEKVLIL